MPTRKAPRNCYWRGNVLWGRIQVNGKEVRWSLRTGNGKIAARRHEERRQWIILDIAADRPPPPKTNLQPNGKPLIYFIAKPGFVKIGVTRNLRERLNTLNTSSPEPLILLFTAEGNEYAERRLHGQFAHLRVSGEWFRLEGDLMAFCRKHLQPGPIPEMGMSARQPKPTFRADIVELYPRERVDVEA